jgi:hypothetical protein
MRTLQSLLNNLNLKKLIPAIRHIQTKPTLPFYALKVQNKVQSLPPSFGLSLTYLLSKSDVRSQTRPSASTKGHYVSGALITCSESLKP